MSTGPEHDVEVAIIGAGVVGCAAALALARAGVSVAILEAEPEPCLGASGTNSGILHTGFDSMPGELETELILASGRLRAPLVDALGLPVLRCGAVMTPRDGAQRDAIAALAENAARNGVAAVLSSDGALSVPGESVTDPVLYTLALAGAAQAFGAQLRCDWTVASLDVTSDGLVIARADGERLACRVAVNCAGLEADAVARLAGDDSFEIYPRKGEFLVFDPPEGQPLERILLPVPTALTKGVLVFPTLDGKVVAGPTAVDQRDKHDWSVRDDAPDEIMRKALEMYPQLADARLVSSYAGLRPAGRGINYLIGPSRVCPRLVHVAAIRSTGLTASLGIAQHVTRVVGSLDVALEPDRELPTAPLPTSRQPWWRRTAEFRAATR